MICRYTFRMCKSFEKKYETHKTKLKFQQEKPYFYIDTRGLHALRYIYLLFWSTIEQHIVLLYHAHKDDLPY